jgi:hypothetical protein
MSIKNRKMRLNTHPFFQILAHAPMVPLCRPLHLRCRDFDEKKQQQNADKYPPGLVLFPGGQVGFEPLGLAIFGSCFDGSLPPFTPTLLVFQ